MRDFGFTIQAFIEKKIVGDDPSRTAWRRELVRACASFIQSGLADPKFLDELVSGEEHKFWACLSEALVAQQLAARNLPLRPNHGVGPDFLVMDGGRKVWIEVVCPEPARVPEDWLTLRPGVGNFPHEEILLRWTSAIKAKAERLLGSVDRPEGYLASGLVSREDAYVIAVNGCRLRNGPFSSLMGISGFPFAVEAAFGIGPLQVIINGDTNETVGTSYQHRPFVKNRNGSNVPAHTFLDPAFEVISAIWAVDLNACSVFGGREPTCVVHNPNAIRPLPVGFLPSLHDFVARRDGDDFVLDGPRFHF